MTNNAAERALRPIAVGRKNWTFAGSDEGGRRAAAIYTLIQTAKLNDVDPQAWLADVLARLPTIPPSASISFCPGTGSANACKRPLRSSYQQISRSRKSTAPWPSPDAYGTERRRRSVGGKRPRRQII